MPRDALEDIFKEEPNPKSHTRRLIMKLCVGYKIGGTGLNDYVKPVEPHPYRVGDSWEYSMCPDHLAELRVYKKSLRSGANDGELK